MRPSAVYTHSTKVERVLHAPPERVYRAWLDAEWVCRWMRQGDVTTDRAIVEPWVGGRFQIWQSRDGEQVGGAEGRFIEMVPNRKLVYRWAFVGPERKHGEFYETLVTVELTPESGGRTRVVISHEHADDLQSGGPEIVAQVAPAWNSCLDKLEGELLHADSTGSMSARPRESKR